MTRLTEADVSELLNGWSALPARLAALTGLDLAGLAASALDLPRGAAAELLEAQKVAVVPDNSGGGLIEGFGQALVLIAGRLGAGAFLTAPGPAGFVAARAAGATMTLSAGDDDYLAVHLASGKVSENGRATGRGFAEALVRMAERNGRPVAGARVLVVGAGPVGRSAAARLRRHGAVPVVLDLDPDLAARAAAEAPGAMVWTPELGPLPTGFGLIVEASTAPVLWPAESFAPGTLVAAPGMPRSVPESPSVLQWHEPLATGTAVMILEAALPLEGRA
jgi:pyrrolysine biosynthesis protein PylD